jgi:hypothetical protein
LEAKEGYLKLGAKYVLFLWQQIPKDRAYMLNEGYLLQQGRVFPVKANFEQSHFAGMPEDQFLKAVKSAIKGGIDIQ